MGISYGRCFHRADHEIFCRVFDGDELRHVGAIAHDAQDRRAEGVGEDVAHALEENSVFEDGQ